MTTCIPRVDGLSMNPRIKASQEFLNSIFKYFKKNRFYIQIIAQSIIL